jgi:trehalose 6-phosphate synthase/phosphatase
MQEKRLFIVSNRLPVSVEPCNGDFSIKASAGGLVTAINSFIKKGGSADLPFSKIFWVGVPGSSPGLWSRAEAHLPEAGFDYLPVFINKSIYDGYYKGFSNSVVWPLFHYFPSYAEFSSENFESYLTANTNFLNVILKNARRDDIIWIHDYHLLPLADMIRKEMPGMTIGFFLHIPFPSFEIIRLMPKKWQLAIMRGMLGADLIGFHTVDYASHFLECARVILGVDHEMNIMRYNDRLIKADIFPIGIDYDCFNNSANDAVVLNLSRNFRQKFQGKKIIFSVDRLDYTKGLSNRLSAYEHFLTTNPSYHEKVVFILVVVPSRDTISKYAERKKMIDESISNINSKIGNVHWQPVVYQYRSLTFDEMMALYITCDIAMITPMRDGMNLVAKEFVASRRDLKGVLLLSEMAGAARELTDALVINPNDIDEMAEKLKEGFEMPAAEQQRRNQAMQARIKSYDVNTWAEDFLNQLKRIKAKQNDFQIKLLDELTKLFMFDEYSKAEKRLLLLDYDGTLISYSALPSKATPGTALLELIQTISSAPQNDLYIISGRDRRTLENWFGHLPVNIVAEHGAAFRRTNEEWQYFVEDRLEWKEGARKIMETYVKRCANSLIEEKEFSMVWHYRNSNAEQGKLRAFELMKELSQFAHNLGIHVMMGNKIVEIKNRNIDKGKAVRSILSQKDYDFIFAAGDDLTDEDIFRLLVDTPNAFTFKIGADASYAKYNLLTPQMVLSTLHAMSHIPEMTYK